MRTQKTDIRLIIYANKNKDTWKTSIEEVIYMMDGREKKTLDGKNTPEYIEFNFDRYEFPNQKGTLTLAVPKEDSMTYLNRDNVTAVVGFVKFDNNQFCTKLYDALSDLQK